MILPNVSTNQILYRPRRGILQRIQNGLVSVFLPIGYPESVTDDFTRYRALETLQGTISQAALLLANRAVLQGVGVGDPSSTATSAVLMTVIQDTTGRFATILFAWLASSALGTEPQKYKLLADLLYDIALLSDCLVPRSVHYRLPLLCFSGVSRALCGVIAGGVGATITAHFAKWGNLADVSAKSTSLATVSQLFGTIVGTWLLHRCRSTETTWFALITFIFLHLGVNYLCVSSLVLLTINRQRASLILSDLLNWEFEPKSSSGIATPLQISKRERLFSDPRRLSSKYHTADIGVSPSAVFRIMSGHPDERKQLLHTIFAGEDYILWYQRPDANRVHVLISLSSHSLKAHLRAWAHAYVLAGLVAGKNSTEHASEKVDPSAVVVEALNRVKVVLDADGGIEMALKNEGWNVDVSMMCPNEAHGEGRTLDEMGIGDKVD